MSGTWVGNVDAVSGAYGTPTYGLTAGDSSGLTLMADTSATSAAGATGSATSGLGGIAGGISLGASIGQALGSVYSAWLGGKTSKELSRMQATISDYNRRMAQLGAESAYLQGQSQIAAITQRAGAVKSAQRTGYAARGVALGTGSTAEVTATTDIMKSIDVASAKMNAMEAAWGYKKQALSQNAQASISSISGSYATKIGGAQAIGDGLAGAAEVAEKWYKMGGALNNTPSNK